VVTLTNCGTSAAAHSVIFGGVLFAEVIVTKRRDGCRQLAVADPGGGERDAPTYSSFSREKYRLSLTDLQIGYFLKILYCAMFDKLLQPEAIFTQIA